MYVELVFNFTNINLMFLIVKRFNLEQFNIKYIFFSEVYSKNVNSCRNETQN